MNTQVTYRSSKPAPTRLQKMQEWFGKTITMPLEENKYIQNTTPQGFLVAEESARYIIPSPTLKPDQRIQIYNQQYWWRLLKTLQLNFPILTRMFGINAFNEEIGVPYLLRFPPNHWSLTTLGSQLTNWIESDYHEIDKVLLYQSALLDWTFSESFIAAQCPLLNLVELNESNVENFLNIPLYLQPHVHLFTWNYDLLSFRQAFLKEEIDFWETHDFPELIATEPKFFVLYRTCKYTIAWREICEGEFTLLSYFKKGKSLEQACEEIENLKTSIRESIEKNLEQWLTQWTQSNLLTLSLSKQE